jgi:hypothetical protein
MRAGRIDEAASILNNIEKDEKVSRTGEGCCKAHVVKN